VPPTVHIVFSRRPQTITQEQYDRWYEAYISRVPGVPGFAAVGRYDLVPALDEPAEPDRFTSAAIYETERSAPEAMTALTAGLSADRVDMPEWFGEIRSSSWLADPLGPRVERGRNEGTTWAQSLQLVFSDAGEAEDHPVSDQSFDGWYERHLDEILSIPGFTSAQRYKLETVARPEGGTIPGRRLCVYTTSKPPAELRAEMERMNLLSADSYSRLKDTDSTGPALPEWWDTVRFASWNLIPAGPAS
jgi:hypothetical protein